VIIFLSLKHHKFNKNDSQVCKGYVKVCKKRRVSSSIGLESMLKNDPSVRIAFLLANGFMDSKAKILGLLRMPEKLLR
jgi:hypothetical protein